MALLYVREWRVCWLNCYVVLIALVRGLFVTVCTLSTPERGRISLFVRDCPSAYCSRRVSNLMYD